MTEPARSVVIGGGVLGCFTALELARHGIHTTLVEAAELGGGTSGSSFAWVNASAKGPYDYFRLNADGVAAWHGVESEWGSGSPFHRVGNLDWARTPGLDAGAAGTLAGKAETLQEWGYNVALLSRREAAALEPTINFGDAVDGVLHLPDEGFVHAPSLFRVLRARLIDDGVRIREQTAVTNVEDSAGRPTVLLADGSRLPADYVVVACGNGAPSLLGHTAMHPFLREPGVDRGMYGLLVTATSARRFRSVIHAPDLNARPDQGESIILHSEAVDALIENPDDVSSLVDELVQRGSGRTGAGVVPLGSRVGTRIVPRDERSIVGWLPGFERCYVLLTHSGMTLGPLLGRLVAEEIRTEQGSSQLDAFRPQRFAETAQVGG
jgi:glycine/D-amino acid oxidase-like deaminating enzyme